MYSIKFIDGTIFNGSAPENSLWNQIPDKPIQSLTYKIFGKTIIMENYESYNHLVEYCSFIQSYGSFINKVILMGKKDSVVFKLEIDLKKGTIKPSMVKFGKEYNNNPTIGWKKGVFGLKERSRVS